MRQLRFVLVFLIASLLGVPVASAQGVRIDSGPPDATLVLRQAPDRYTTTVEPGTAKNGVVDVLNMGRAPLRIRMVVQSARMTGGDGELRFEKGGNPFTLESFVQTDTEPFTLKPGEAQRVPFRITVPKGAWPGGYFGALFSEVILEQDTKATVSQTGRVGTLLIVQVAGKVDVDASIKRLRIRGDALGNSREALAEFANDGNTDEKPLGAAIAPRGTLTVENLLGQDVVDRKVRGPLTFPGARRSLPVIKVDRDVWFGRYSATLNLKTGSGETVTKTTHFWAFSVAGMVIALIVVSAVCGAIFLLRHWRRGRSA